MKKLNFLAAALVSAMTLFTSCLGNGGNEVNVPILGVVFMNPDAGYKPMVDVGNGYLYIPQMTNSGEFMEGTCVSANVHIDYNDPANANSAATGYVTASLNSEAQVIDNWSVSYINSEADTTQVLIDEIPVVSACNGMTSPIRGFCFVSSNVKVGSKQDLRWTLTYSPDLKAEMIGGKNYYNLYIRVTATGNDEGASNTSVINAFRMKELIDRINDMEKNAGNTEYYLRFNYVESIDDETQQLTWGHNDILGYVVKDNESTTAL